MSAVVEDVLGQYFADVRRHRLLTKDDERRLGQAVQLGRQAEAELAKGGRELMPAERGRLARLAREGAAAQRQFVEANLRLVIAIAKRYRSSGVPLEDLVQEGNIGLLRAVERFDWQRGFRFSTYASWWIRQAIAQGIRTSSHAIYRPAHVCDRERAVQEAQQRLEVTLGRRPSPSELATDTGLSEHHVVEVMLLASEPRSLFEPTSRDGDGALLGDVIPGPSEDPPFEQLMASRVPVELCRFLSPLTERERLVLALRYGLEGSEPLTLADVAQRLGLTSQRISQITEAAMAKLRHPSWRGMWESVGSMA